MASSSRSGRHGELPTVTVVIVNHNGREFLAPCVQSVLDQDYPSDLVEVLVIDNASTDGSVEMLRADFPTVQVIVNATNDGFAPVVNQGARAGNGHILALLNNDAVAAPAWLRELVLPLMNNDNVKVTGGLVLDHTGSEVDFAGGDLSFYGHGFARHREDPPPPDLVREPTIFVTGASMAVPRKWFLSVGGFDEDYFAFFEDVDFGWRTWVLGYECWFVPESVVYHRHHGTIERFGQPRERYLLERNALATIFKNYGDDMLARTLPASTILSFLRGFHAEDSDIGDYRIHPDSAETPVPEPKISAMTGAHLAALRDFGLWLEDLRHKRAFVQTNRRRDDRDILRLFRRPIAPNVPDPVFTAVFLKVIDTFDMAWHATSRQRVLILTADTIGAKMAGPAIRVWEMAKTLSREHEVVLASMRKPEMQHPKFKVQHVTAGNIKDLVGWAEVIVTQGFTMYHFPEVAKSDAAVVVDIYDPFHIEALVMRRDEPPAERWATYASDRDIVNDQLERGDLLLCASEKQRDFWLGQIASLGRINPATYDEDPDLRRLLGVAPFGLPDEPPVQTRRAIRDAIDGIGDDDIVLLWGGGIYNWFDPATLIRGLASAVEKEPRLKLFFLGTAHPNPDVPRCPRRRGLPRRRGDSGCSAPTCSSTAAGSTTTTAPTTCSTRTSACPRTSCTSRPSSASAPASSTTSGPACRSSRPRATRCRGWSRSTISARSWAPRTPTRSPRRCSAWPTPSVRRRRAPTSRRSPRP
jgi:GT2 family glycosyltransferase